MGVFPKVPRAPGEKGLRVESDAGARAHLPLPSWDSSQRGSAGDPTACRRQSLASPSFTAHERCEFCLSPARWLLCRRWKLPSPRLPGGPLEEAGLKDWEDRQWQAQVPWCDFAHAARPAGDDPLKQGPVRATTGGAHSAQQVSKGNLLLAALGRAILAWDWLVVRCSLLPCRPGPSRGRLHLHERPRVGTCVPGDSLTAEPYPIARTQTIPCRRGASPCCGASSCTAWFTPPPSEVLPRPGGGAGRDGRPVLVPAPDHDGPAGGTPGRLRRLAPNGSSGPRCNQ